MHLINSYIHAGFKDLKKICLSVETIFSIHQAKLQSQSQITTQINPKHKNQVITSTILYLRRYIHLFFSDTTTSRKNKTQAKKDAYVNGKLLRQPRPDKR